MRFSADGGGFAHPPGFALKFARPGSITQPTHLESGFVVRLAGRGVGSERCTNRGCLARAVPVDVTPVADNGMPETEFSLRVIDISIGGCALFLPDDVPMMNAGVVIGGVRMDLDDDTKLDVNLRLQHVTSLNSEARGLRLGFEYIRPGGDTLRTLQRFIDLTQKRGKLMALN